MAKILERRWEAPDPAFWVEHGYTLVNCDLRGWGHSDVVGQLVSAQEGRDVHDVVEWVAAQPWCTAKVGMLGVSYLAITQWAAVAERPPHLAAICLWEGFTDAYRDFMRPGGVREDGFLRLWEAVLTSQRRSPVHVLRDSKCERTRRRSPRCAASPRGRSTARRGNRASWRPTAG